jgi:hypothetical protein
MTPHAIHGFDKRLLAMWRSLRGKVGFAKAAQATLGASRCPISGSPISTTCDLLACRCMMEGWPSPP